MGPKGPFFYGELMTKLKLEGLTFKKSEHYEQVLFVMWFRKQYPKHKIFAIPNGGSRGTGISAKVTGSMLKAEGVDPGVPDLMIPAAKMFIEMKSKSGKIKDEQQEYIDYLKECGYKVYVAYGADEAIQYTKAAMGDIL